jgi:hypothetical protein
MTAVGSGGGEGSLAVRNNVAKLTKLTRNGGVCVAGASGSGTKFMKFTVPAASALVCCGDEKERAAKGPVPQLEHNRNTEV